MTMHTVAHSEYARAAAATASPYEVVRMAYERIIAACDRATMAQQHQQDGWVQLFHDETIRAQQILVELTSVLAVGSDNAAVADLSTSLDSIYSFAMQQLALANTQKAAEPLRVVRRLIDGLRDAWVATN